jgi:hypothetical protein
MKIISVDDDVTAYEVCNDFGIFVCGDEERLRFGSWDEAQAFRHAHTKKGRAFSSLIGSLLCSDTLSGHRNVVPQDKAVANLMCRIDVSKSHL